MRRANVGFQMSKSFGFTWPLRYPYSRRPKIKALSAATFFSACLAALELDGVVFRKFKLEL